MVVFSSHRLGPSAELFVSDDVAVTILRETASAARPFAEARWEVELVLWLDSRADLGAQQLDIDDIAWTPDHFEPQRAFLIAALQRAARCGEHALAFDRIRRMVESHPADSVQVGRRWRWPAGEKPASRTEPANHPVNPDLADVNPA